jgi:predicted O-methyltransferase YrrM
MAHRRLERRAATTKASKAVTARQAGAPAARRRSQREPVEPCASTRSPSRTVALGSTTGWASSAMIAKCPMWTVSSKRSSVARSLLALGDSRVIDVLLTRRVCRRDTLDQAGRPDPLGSAPTVSPMSIP